MSSEGSSNTSPGASLAYPLFPAIFNNNIKRSLLARLFCWFGLNGAGFHDKINPSGYSLTKNDFSRDGFNWTAIANDNIKQKSFKIETNRNLIMNQISYNSYSI